MPAWLPRREGAHQVPHKVALKQAAFTGILGGA